MKLNLGCSDSLISGFVNVDIASPADQLADLRQPWPWPDSSVEFIRAHDILEHLPDKILTLNEAYRVLIPYGVMEMIVPTTDGRGAWQDPTHTSYWNVNSLMYLEVGNAHNTRFKDAYGIRHQFQIVHQKHELLADSVWKLTARLAAVK
jgi:SAM-dependent methyltransferase